MLKLARRAREHFVTLIEIRVHLIRVKPGHIPSFCKFNTFKVAYYSFPKKKDQDFEICEIKVTGCLF